MASIQDKLLKLLIRKYENSRTYEGSNKVSQSFSVKPDRLMKDYYSDYVDPDEIADFENSLKELENRGWIVLEYKKNSGIVRSIRLNEDSIERIREALGIMDKNLALEDEIAYYRELMGSEDEIQEGISDSSLGETRTENDSFRSGSRRGDSVRSWYCTEEIERLRSGKKARFNREEAKTLTELAGFILANDKECLERELSIRFFGNSKTFETEYRRKVCRLISSYLNYDSQDSISDAEADRLLLEEYGIYKNPSYVYVKGDASLTYAGGKVLEMKNGMPIALSGALLETTEAIVLRPLRVMTIENLTSFHRMQDDSFFYIYTGGYHGRAVRTLIRIIEQNNTKTKYFHFGDIDPDGFLIMENLSESCGINIEPLHMGIGELDKYRSYTKTLTDNDRVKATGLISQGKHTEIIEYMLEHNIKLEQEIVAYGL